MWGLAGVWRLPKCCDTDQRFLSDALQTSDRLLRYSPPPMSEPRFDIFSGTPKKDPTWIEEVEGLSSAYRRMNELAAATPGQYFIFSNGSVIARTETFAQPRSPKSDDQDGAP